MFLYIQSKSNLFTFSRLRRNPIQDLRVSLRPSVISFSYERQCRSSQIYNIFYGPTRAYLKVPAFSVKGNARLPLQLLLLSPCNIVHPFCHRRNTVETDIQNRFVGRSAIHPSYGRHPAKEAKILGHKKEVIKGQHRRGKTEGRGHIYTFSSQKLTLLLPFCEQLRSHVQGKLKNFISCGYSSCFSQQALLFMQTATNFYLDFMVLCRIMHKMAFKSYIGIVM